MSRNQIDKLSDAVHKIDQAYDVWASRHGLTVYELEIYYVMLKRDTLCITQTALCRELCAPKTSINSMIKRQLQTGRITMQINEKNKREKIISLTPEGERYARELVTPLFQYEQEAAALLSAQELELAIQVHTRFADALLGKVGRNE